jgi:hypothetical protein
MFKKLNGLVITALFTSGAIIAFAFYQRYEAPYTVPAVAFYFAAAVICLLPVLYGLLRHKTCRNRTRT